MYLLFTKPSSKQYHLLLLQWLFSEEACQPSQPEVSEPYNFYSVYSPTCIWEVNVPHNDASLSSVCFSNNIKEIWIKIQIQP